MIVHGQPGQSLVGLGVAATAVIAVARGLAGSRAKAAPGRLRAVAWNLVLVALSAVFASAVGAAPGAALLMLAAVAAVIVVRPRWVRGASAVVLIATGLAGFALAQRAAFGLGGGDSYDQTFGIARVGGDDLPFSLLLPQSYLFVLAGGVLGWRS